jgi:signal transduction histidine kinase
MDVGQRRTRLLRELACVAEGAGSLDAYFALAAKSIAESELGLPFLLFYVLDDPGRRARRVAHAGTLPGPDASPEVVDLPGGPRTWPFAEALAAGAPLPVDDLARRFPELAGAACAGAYVLPIVDRAARGVALAVVGASDEPAGFFDSLAAVLTSGAVATTLVAAERARADGFAQLDREKTAFLSHVSQEFRKRLMLVLSPLEEELGDDDPPLPPGRRARLEIAQRNSAGLLRTVSALLDFSFIEEGRMKPTFEAVDIASVTDAIVTTFRGPIEKAGLRLSTRLEALSEPVYVDREMWTKIVVNLLSNALKHTFRGGITVSLFASEEAPDHIELRVDDTGTGIPAKEIPRLFTRFHRVRRVRARSDDGSGIGLALVRAFARLHGGDVRVVSREGLGSSFRVHVPRRATTAPGGEAGGARAQGTLPADVGGYADDAMRWADNLGSHSSETDQAEGSNVAEGPRARVLWADGNGDTRAYVARLLGRVHHVEAVADAEAVLDAAAEHPPDLVLLDVALPGKDGLALLRELRELERTRLVPVILVSSSADEGAAIEGLDAGADDYLVKPFTAKALQARVRSRLSLARLRKEYADRLAVANKELEAFSYSVSHDLRAPLRAIDGFSQILASDYAEAFDDDGRRFLDRIRAATQRMAQLIDDLLNLSRITRLQLADEPVDLTALAQTVLGDLAARDPGRKVAWDVGSGLAGRGDPRLVRVLLENLLGNAWKFSSKRADARIEVGAELRDGEATFFVRDNGAGFDMEYAEKLFAPFQRLHAATDFPGTGIGLATVHRVVARHGGRVWAASAPGEGATFFFTLGGQPR